MFYANSGFIEGVVDVSIIIPVCFKNPLKKFAVDFLSNILKLKRVCIIPVSAIIGAYHIVTKYLGVPRLHAKKTLVGLLETRSPVLYPPIEIGVAINALDYASAYNIESWDGYLVALAKSLKTNVIYSLDKKLASVVEDLIVINPFPEKATKEYHSYLKSIVKRP